MAQRRDLNVQPGLQGFQPRPPRQPSIPAPSSAAVRESQTAIGANPHGSPSSVDDAMEAFRAHTNSLRDADVEQLARVTLQANDRRLDGLMSREQHAVIMSQVNAEISRRGMSWEDVESAVQRVMREQP